MRELEEENNLRKALATGNVPKNTTRKGIKERLRQMKRENKQRFQDHQQDKAILRTTPRRIFIDKLNREYRCGC